MSDDDITVFKVSAGPRALTREEVQAMHDNDERIARLTELARRLPEWADKQDVRIYVDGARGLASVTFADSPCSRSRLLAVEHPRALDALEAALLVLAGEWSDGIVEVREEWDRQLERWVEQLAADFDRLSAEKDEAGKGCAAWAYLDAAKMLRARAKGGERWGSKESER